MQEAITGSVGLMKEKNFMIKESMSDTIANQKPFLANTISAKRLLPDYGNANEVLNTLPPSNVKEKRISVN